MSKQEFNVDYSTDVTYLQQREDPVIVKKINSLDFISYDIKLETIKVYQENAHLRSNSDRSPRGEKQLQWIFLCILKAFENKGVYYSINDIMDNLGIKNSYLNKSISKIGIDIEYSVNDMITTYLVDLYKNNVFGESKFNAIQNGVMNLLIFIDLHPYGREKLNDTYSGKIATGLILLYLLPYTNISNDIIDRVFKISASCSNRYKNDMQEICYHIIELYKTCNINNSFINDISNYLLYTKDKKFESYNLHD